MTTQNRGKFSREQVTQLLNPVEPWRVVTGAHVKPHLSQQDVLAHLNRMFGFGNFDIEVISSELIFEEPMTNSNNKPAWSVGYRAIVRLTVRDEHGSFVAFYDGGSTGESEGQPSRADSHDLAFKSALSTATKRAAIHLGDQFGLSLYNKGQMQALVMGTMVGANWQADTLADGPQQEVDGGSVAERQDAAAEEAQVEPEQPTALPPATKRATKGRQGTRKSKPAPEPVADDAAPEAVPEVAPEPEAAPEPVAEPMPEPEPTPEPVAPAPAAEDSEMSEERAERERMAAEQTRQVSQREAIIASADEVDREDEAAVKAWNAEHGKATGHYITSAAEMERQRAKLEAAEVEEQPEPVEDAPQYIDKNGDVYDTQEELDAAIRARVQGSVNTDAGQVVGTISANAKTFEEVVAESPADYAAQLAAAVTVAQTKDVWVRAQADEANPMTQELKFEILRVKQALEVQA